jgi:hypothetical protein
MSSAPWPDQRVGSRGCGLGQRRKEKTQGLGLRGPPASFAAARRVSAEATIALKRGSSRRGSRSGSALAWFSQAMAIVSKTGPSNSSAASMPRVFLRPAGFTSNLRSCASRAAVCGNALCGSDQFLRSLEDRFNGAQSASSPGRADQNIAELLIACLIRVLSAS